METNMKKAKLISLLFMSICSTAVFADIMQTVHLCNNTQNTNFHFENSYSYQINEIAPDAKDFWLNPSECKDLQFMPMNNPFPRDIEDDQMQWKDDTYGGFDVTIDNSHSPTIYGYPLKLKGAPWIHDFNVTYNSPTYGNQALNINIADK
jgi:opacity protein-like surface antigen